MSGRKRSWREMDHNQNYQYVRGPPYGSSHFNAAQAGWPGFHQSYSPEFQHAGPHFSNPAYPTSPPVQNFPQWTHQQNQPYPGPTSASVSPRTTVRGPTEADFGQRAFPYRDQHPLQHHQRQDVQSPSLFAVNPHLPHFSDSRGGPPWRRYDSGVGQQQFFPHGQRHAGFPGQLGTGHGSVASPSQRLSAPSAGPPPPPCASHRGSAQHDQQHPTSSYGQRNPRQDLEQHDQPNAQNYYHQSPPRQVHAKYHQQSHDTYPQRGVVSEASRLLYPHSGNYNATSSPTPPEARLYASDASHAHDNLSQQEQETGGDAGDSPDKQTQQTGGRRRRGKKGGAPETGTATDKTPQDEKEKLTKEMVKSVKERFPNLHNQLHFVPPLRFFKTRYTKVAQYSTPKHQVIEQGLTDPSAMIGDLTEDAVTKCVARMVEATEEPMFVLLNYQFDYYLFELGRNAGNKEKKKSKGTGVPGMLPEDCGSEFPDDTTPEVVVEENPKGKHSSGKSCHGSQTVISESSGKQETGCNDSSATKIQNHFPIPIHLGEKFKRGESDILIVHPRLGFIVFEVKTMRGSVQNVDQEPVSESSHSGHSCTGEIHTPRATGDENINTEGIHKPRTTGDENINTVGIHKPGTTGDENPNTEGTPQFNNESADAEEWSMIGSEESELAKGITDQDVVKTIKKGLKQLKKATEVLCHLVSDLPEQPTVTTVLALLNISRARLRKLADDPDVSSVFREHFQTTEIEEALGRCLCAEEAAPYPYVQTTSEESGETIQDDSLMLRWWADLTQKILAHGGGHGPPDGRVLSKEIYEQIIGRFCGKYSRLSGATTAECINLTGVHFGQSILREEQLNILNSDERFVSIIGPPGTGKTLVLALKASDWALEGYHVVILCKEGVDWGTLVSWTLHERVRERARSDGKKRSSGQGVRKESEDEDKRAGKDARRPKEGGQAQAGRTSRDDTETCVEIKTKDGRAEDDDEKRRTQRDDMPEDGATQEAMTLRTERKTKTDEDFDVATRGDVLTVQYRMVPKDRKTRDGDRTDKDTAVDEKERTHTVDDEIHPLAKTVVKEDSTIIPTHWLSRSTAAQSPAVEGDNQCVPTTAESSSSCTLRRAPDNNPRVDYSEFVHLERIHTTAIADTFVKGLLAKYTGGKGVKFVLDEFQRQSTIEEQVHRLDMCKTNLLKIKSLYEELFTASGSPHPDGDAREADSLLPRSVVSNTESYCFTKQPQSCLRSVWEDPFSALSENQGRKSSIHQNQPISPHRKQSHPDIQEQSKKGSARQTEARPANQGPSQAKKTNRRVSHKKKTSSSPTDKAEDSCHRLSKQDLFSSMDTRLGYMFNRLDVLRASNGSRYFGSADLWEESLNRLESLTEDVKSYRLQAEHVVNLGEQKDTDADFLADILENIDALMVRALGDLFNAYNALTFFVEDEILAQVRQIQQQDPSLDISLWSSCVCPHYRPEGYVVKTLHQILRCTPKVQEIMMLTENDLPKPPNYTYNTRGCDANPPLPSDGPDVKWINHAPHMKSVTEIIDCQKCAQAFTDYLLVDLKVSQGHGKKQSSKDCLYFHDVLLSGSPIHKPDCVFVKELKKRKIPLVYESQNLQSPPPYPGSICVIGGSIAQGLEAKITVYVPEIKRIFDEKANSPNAVSDGACSTEENSERVVSPPEKSGRRPSDSVRRAELIRRLDDLGHWNRQYLHQIASRSLSHLIVFHV